MDRQQHTHDIMNKNNNLYCCILNCELKYGIIEKKYSNIELFGHKQAHKTILLNHSETLHNTLYIIQHRG